MGRGSRAARGAAVLNESDLGGAENTRGEGAGSCPLPRAPSLPRPGWWYWGCFWPCREAKDGDLVQACVCVCVCVCARARALPRVHVRELACMCMCERRVCLCVSAPVRVCERARAEWVRWSRGKEETRRAEILDQSPGRAAQPPRCCCFLALPLLWAQ